MTLLMPTLSRRSGIGSVREWSLLVPVFARQGRDYDIMTDSFRTGGWMYCVRITVSREWRAVSLRVSWGKSLYGVGLLS